MDNFLIANGNKTSLSKLQVGQVLNLRFHTTNRKRNVLQSRSLLFICDLDIGL